jgi:1-acyl-sn-glycerol-3-phosphate acyltransferase
MAPSAAPRAGADGVSGHRIYRLLRAPTRGLLTALFDLRIDGLEHVPSRGPYLVAANHHNYLDGIVLGAALPVPVAFLAMTRLWRTTPIHPLLHWAVGTIPLDVDRPDVGALRAALAQLGRGRVVGIFPEGPFSVRGRLERGLPGVALLALRSGVPVVPAGIRGTYEALLGRRFYVPRRHPLAVRFGRPRRYAEGDAVRETRRRVTERIMADIAALLQ